MVYRYPQFISANDFDDIKYEIISCVKNLNAFGLNRGSSGNVSVRTKKGFYITPSGIDPSNLTLDSIVEMDFDGKIISGQNPSSEWKFHRDILKNKSQVNAVIHTHSVYATAFSCLRVDMPSFHYMVAVAGGHNIKCSKYALFGSQELSDNVIKSLEDRRACFLANHGMISIGTDLKRAFDIATEIESLAQQFMTLKSIGDFVLLTEAEMNDVLEKFKNYGSWNK
jgi:L-fuculose-phosphate aldolase